MNITADNLKQAGFTVETDGAKSFIAEIEAAHKYISENGSDWEKNSGNFAWNVARRAIGEDKSFMELATLINELGLSESVVNDEFYCTSAKTVADQVLYQLTTELVKIAIEEQ